MKKIHLIIACIISFFCGSCNTPTAPEEEGPTFTSVSVEEFAKCIEGKNVVILDVRTDNEYNAGHIENAINIDYYKNDFEEQAVATLPKDKTIATYCRSGNRSKKAGEILFSNGFTVVELDNGINGWTAAGMPTVK